MEETQIDIKADVEAISRIDAIPAMLEVVCRTTGMGFSAVARVTDNEWVACAVRDEIQFGLKPGGGLKLETTICNEIRQHHQPVIIDNVPEDEHFRGHHTPEIYGFKSYISVPIMLKNGEFFGTLCAIDPRPALLNNTTTRNTFKLFAELISFHLDAVSRLETSESTLREEKETAELREQFIAILGHDLRNPVGAVSNVAQLLMRMPLDERMTKLTRILKDASFRMKGLIENILDFARGRLGEGIILDRNDAEPLEDILNQVIAELSLIWPDCQIVTDFNIDTPVNCDGNRIGQLFSNLLGNALTYGKRDQPVIVTAKAVDKDFILSVSNAGNKIPDSAIKRLFQPFSRGNAENGSKGLGLGLYIAAEIARSHGGTLNVLSTNERTVFTLQIPV